MCYNLDKTLQFHCIWRRGGEKKCKGQEDEQGGFLSYMEARGNFEEVRG